VVVVDVAAVVVRTVAAPPALEVRNMAREADVSVEPVGALTILCRCGCKEPSDGDGDKARLSPVVDTSERRHVGLSGCRDPRGAGAAGDARPVPGDGDLLACLPQGLHPARGLLVSVFSDCTRVSPGEAQGLLL